MLQWVALPRPFPRVIRAIILSLGKVSLSFCYEMQT